jgi:sugar lactone lactonase YvrE
MRNQFFALAAVSMLFTACGSAPEQTSQAPAPTPAPVAAPDIPATIVAARAGFIPEGIEYDTRNRRILTGSLSEGTIFEIKNDGSVTPAVTDPDLKSSIGIEADEERDRLLVANSDFSIFQGKGTGQAKLGVYNLSTGARLAMVDLAAADTGAPKDAVHFANDVTVGDDGTAYVTDSRTNVVYRVDPGYKASVLHRFVPAKGLALNGIVYHPSGYLLVTSGATLYKVPIDKPAGLTEVKLPEPVPGQDGMLWTSDGRLAIVSNSDNRVVALTSKDDWGTAQIAGVAKFATQATTGAAVGNDIYVVHPHFADKDPPSVERVTLQ